MAEDIKDFFTQVEDIENNLINIGMWQEQIVLGAAKIIKARCAEVGDDCTNKPDVCPFQEPGANFGRLKIYHCGLYGCHPTNWKIKGD